MRTRTLLALSSLLLLLGEAPALADDAAALVGTWKLLSWEQTRLSDESKKVFAEG